MITEKSIRYTAYFPEPPLVIAPGSFKGDSQELARLIQKQVDNYPESFDMGFWVTTTGDSCVTTANSPSYRLSDKRIADLQAQDGTMCGTTMCIAGYAQLFVDGEITEDVQNRASELLGLNEDSELFYTRNEIARELLENLANGTYDDECERRAWMSSDREEGYAD